MTSIVRAVGQGVFWNTSSTVVGKVFIFLNIFLILSSLSVYEYGLSELVLSVITFLSIMQLPGLSSAVIADLAVERAQANWGRMKSIFLQFFALNVALSILAWAVLFFGSNIAAHLVGNETIGYLLKIVSFSLLVTPLRVASVMLAAVELRFRDQSFYGVVEEMVKCFFLVIFFFGLGYGIVGLLFAAVLSQLGAALIFMPRTFSAYRVFSHAHAEDAHRFWEIVREHRKWGILSTYVGTLGQSLQLWVIRFTVGSTEVVGLYAFVYGVYSQIASFFPLPNLLNVLLPRYLDRMHDFTRYVQSSIRLHVYISVVLMGVTWVSLPVFAYIFPHYRDAIALFWPFYGAILASGVVSIYGPVFAVLKEQYRFFWSIVFKVAIVLTSMAICITAFGAIGMTIGATIGILLSMIERTWMPWGVRAVLPGFRFPNLFTWDLHERELWRKVSERSPLIRMLSRKNDGGST